jgi:hypothetical protein
MAIRLPEIIDRISITVPLDTSQLMTCDKYLWIALKTWKGKPKQVKGGWRITFDFGNGVWVAITVARLYANRYLQYDMKPTELNEVKFAKFLELASSFPGATVKSRVCCKFVDGMRFAQRMPCVP